MKKLLFVLPITLLLGSATSVAVPNTLSSKTVLRANESSEMKDLLRWFKKYKEGVLMKGTVTQTRAKAIGFDPSTQSGYVYEDAEPQSYGVNIYFENGKRTGTAIIHTGNIGDLETISDELVVYEDEEGYAYSETLDHTNSLFRSYKLEDDNKLSFASSGLTNIFKFIEPEDITYDSVKLRYDLNVDKASVITKNLLGHQNVGFTRPVNAAYFTFANNIVEGLTIEMNPHYTFDTETETPIKISNRATFKFSEDRTCKIPHTDKYPANPDNQLLNTAFKSLGDNFTLTMTRDVDVNDIEGAKDYKKFKFDGERILVHKYNNPKYANTRGENDFLLTPVDEEESLFAKVYNKETGKFDKNQKNIVGFADSFQGLYYYEDLLPKISEISTDFFKYEKTKNEYICNDLEVLPLINELFYFDKSPFTESDIEYAREIGIRLNIDGSIDHIRYAVDYMDPFLGTKNVGNVYLTFDNVGSTRI